ncbi:MAG: hypothetical protein ABNH00_15435 [Dokdonia sp.]|jgi:protein-L-isoaspartate O-methyltransferase
MTVKEHATSSYITFSGYEGSQHIAGQYAMAKILEMAVTFRVKHILEIGLGIGTLPYLIMEYHKELSSYVGSETNEFCLAALRKNLPEPMFERLNVYTDTAAIFDRDNAFDMLIIDAGFTDYQKLSDHMSKHAVIIIEGDRADQEQKIRSYFPKARFVQLISGEKNHPKGVFDKNHWQGGVKVFFIHPTLAQKWYWLQGKLQSKLNYSKRKRAHA